METSEKIWIENTNFYEQMDQKKQRYKQSL